MKEKGTAQRLCHLKVESEWEGMRLDLFLSRRLPFLSRTRIKRLTERGNILLSGEPVKASRRLRAGEELWVNLPPPEPTHLLPEEIPLNILFEDDSLYVIDKPAGMVVHPGAGNPRGTLVNALLARGGALSGIGGVERPGIVHRLDKGTSGLLLAAKDDLTHRNLSRQLKERRLERRYLAIVQGRVGAEKGVIDAPVGRHPTRRKEMAVLKKGGRAAVTEFFVRERFSAHSLLELRLRSGRTHQVRVHLRHIGHPVAGDPLYGGRRGLTLPLSRQALHAFYIRFIHPRKHEAMAFESPLPADMEASLKLLKERDPVA